MPSPYALKLADKAEALHSKYHLMHETDKELAEEIKSFWADVGATFPGVGTAWSAVFVSACVKRAGASKKEFTFSMRHSTFVYNAIANYKAGKGVFHGRDIADYAPQVGDIIQNNRKKNKFSYTYASKHDKYESHSAIVVETGTDSKGNYALTIGGNEDDSIRQALVRLDGKGLIKQIGSRFIAIVQNLK